MRLAWVVQPEPLGTANAVLAAAAWAGDEPFLAMNADNLYPPSALEALVVARRARAAGVRRATIWCGPATSPRSASCAFALVEVDDEGYLTSIVEKPTDFPPEATSV